MGKGEKWEGRGARESEVRDVGAKWKEGKGREQEPPHLAATSTSAVHSSSRRCWGSIAAASSLPIPNAWASKASTPPRKTPKGTGVFEESPAR